MAEVRGLTEDEIKAACKEPESATKVSVSNFKLIQNSNHYSYLGFSFSTNYVQNQRPKDQSGLLHSDTWHEAVKEFPF